MYSSNSQDYLYGVRQPQTPQNYPSSASQQNHGQLVGHGSTPMQHSNGGYEIMPAPPYYDTAESIQRDFDQYMRETGAMAPLPPAMHHSAQDIHPYNQQRPVMGNPYPTYGDAHAPTRGYQGGQEANFTVSGRGTEPSSSTRPRPPVNKPYSRMGPVAPEECRTLSKDGMIEDSLVYPSASVTLANVIAFGLAGYVVLPQKPFSLGSPDSTRMPPIEFMPKGLYPAGIKIDPMGRVSANHAIENSKHIFSLAPGIREITITILWPGYLHRHFEARVSTDSNGNLTLEELLDRVCYAIVSYFKMLKERMTRISKEDAKWLISEYSGVKVTKCFVAGLLHRGGYYFQPEIWVPRPREK